MGLPGKVDQKVWTFSSSSGKRTYEATLHTDGVASCNCMGWTRRIAADGSRNCKHTRMIVDGTADMNCVDSHDYSQSGQTQKAAQKVPAQKASAKKEAKKQVAADPIVIRGPVVRKIILNKNRG